MDASGILRTLSNIYDGQKNSEQPLTVHCPYRKAS